MIGRTASTTAGYVITVNGERYFPAGEIGSTLKAITQAVRLRGGYVPLRSGSQRVDVLISRGMVVRCEQGSK